jgi:hypothetical protein
MCRLVGGGLAKLRSLTALNSWQKKSCPSFPPQQLQCSIAKDNLSTMSDESKKRKRNADGPKKPSKKIAIEHPSTPAASHPSEIDFSVVQGPDDWAPLVGMFSGRE